ncbi:ARM repeat-containing protein [Gymnopus androsaceus JB14]|uniref:Nucleolar protein 9 n=1 Tax=Gymnopus androsaceus JB14 TaxID=1447944 RepID=A0A6A4GL00_9AGAR|nr:ARM repeat-containing protein [Gymnopus androsaceus JB14]
MPRENRKRERRHKSKANNFDAEVETEAGPSWIVPVPEKTPFGYVDVDVQAYFRTVDIQIRDWPRKPGGGQVGDELKIPMQLNIVINANTLLEKHMFFVAALNEMRGKEKPLATDPDCSIILERMAYSMDDFVRRVFLDSLSGSYEVLVKHRFASHVCQTLLTVAAETIAREAMGNVAKAEDSEGELRTITELVLDICNEILPSFSSLVMDPFASHVIRALLGLLCPTSKRSSSNENSRGAVRSKKSAHWKARQGPLSSVFAAKGKGKEATGHEISPEFRSMSRTFIETIRNNLGDNEVRALAADKVASPCLLMLLDVEAELGMADEPGSLMDRVTVGVISASLDEDTTAIEPSDYLGTLFRDPTSSHLLEIIVSRASDKPFALIWNAYLKGKLARLAVHPVSNFVVAKALERASSSQLGDAYAELQDVWEKMITTSRTGVLRAVVERSVALRTCEQSAVEAAFSALNLCSDEDKKYLVPCMLSLKRLQVYISSTPAQHSAEETNEKKDRKDSSSQTNVQGSLLLQSLLKLSHPHNQPVIDSLTALDPSERLKIAHNATSSRVLDVLLDSETVPSKAKRAFVQSFIGSYHLLVDDRIGSRVGDRCFAFADTFLKEKIGRSLIPQEQFLAGSYYGKFFCRNLNLYLLKRRPDEWKTFQSNKKAATDLATTPTINTNSSAEAGHLTTTGNTGETAPPPSKKKRKRETRVKDEIDELFDSTASTKKAKQTDSAAVTAGHLAAARESAQGSKVKALGGDDVDKELKDVFSAIRAAPKADKVMKGAR